ncbi:MAG: prephenate dehydratase [Salinibacter sp.]
MPRQIAFQGAPGAYSEEAIRRGFETAEPRPYPAFEDVFSAVEEGEVDQGLIPIENAVFGSVRVNYDHLRTHAVTIVGELNLRIQHHLMAPAGATIAALQTVRSHAQALGQCRTWLQSHVPEATVSPAPDTAGAARAVAEAGDPTVAAVASRRAAERYGLTVLAAGLEDNPENFTRFLVLAPEGQGPADTASAPQKTSVAFVLQDNVPGALFKSLAVFALRELDLLKIESRPLVGHPGRYRFFLDVDGRAEDEAVARALDHLREITRGLQVLGSYPHGPTYGEATGTGSE